MRSIGCESDAIVGCAFRYDSTNTFFEGLSNASGNGAASNAATTSGGGTRYFGACAVRAEARKRDSKTAKVLIEGISRLLFVIERRIVSKGNGTFSCLFSAVLGLDLMAMDDANRLLTIALELPEHQRAEMAARLLESLDPHDQEGVDEAWAREIERRCAAMDAGDAITSDWNEFRSQVERDIFGR
ncbi:MAG: addiction module protein [Thermoanaerobaculia bacterium]